MVKPTNDFTYHYRGLSTDKKPTLRPESNGSSFLEMDTGDSYVYDGATKSWILFPTSGGGGGGSYTAGEGITITGSKISVDTTKVAMKTDATKVEKSDINGNIKVDGSEVVVYTLPEVYKDYLDEQTYKKPAIKSFALWLDSTKSASTTIEVGTTEVIANIKHYESNIANIASLAINGQTITPASSLTTVVLTTPVTVGSTTSFTLKGTDTMGNTFSNTQTISVNTYAYSYIGTEQATTGLTKQDTIANFATNGASFSYTAGDYLYLYMKSSGQTVQTYALGQWADVAFTELGETTITQANGVSSAYYCYRVGPFISAGTAKYRVVMSAPTI